MPTSTGQSSSTGTTEQLIQELDARDVFTFCTLSNEEMADLGVTHLPAPTIPPSPVPNTYSVIFDNLDFYIHTHHQSTNLTNKSIHWIHHLCVIDRVPTLHLEKSQPTNCLTEYDLGLSLPDKQNQASLCREFVVLGSRILTTYLEVFKPFSGVVVHHIPHQYSEVISQPSTHVSSCPYYISMQDINLNCVFYCIFITEKVNCFRL